MQLRFQPVQIASVPVAEHVHAIHMAAYAQEAELIGAVDFPPLSRTVEDLRSSGERFLGAYVDNELVGVAGIEQGDGTNAVISSFVVTPTLHRRGVGRALLQRIIALHNHQELRVQTAARNLPALALYRQNGFLELVRWVAGAEPLELVALRRLPLEPRNVA